MTSEEREAQLDFLRESLHRLNPRGAVETQLARTIALDNWRIHRLKGLEETVSSGSPVFSQISLRSSRLSRSAHRNLDLLLKLQSTRQARKPKTRLAPVIDIAACRK